jgi:hypothetical protein
MSRSAPLLLGTVALAIVAAGCAGDDRQVDPAPPRLTIGQAENAIERSGAAIVRDRGRAAVATEVDPDPVASQRYVAQNGRTFAVLSFADRDAATAALPSVRATDVVRRGGAYTRAQNLVAVLPQRPAEKGPYRIVWNTFRRLATR